MAASGGRDAGMVRCHTTVGRIKQDFPSECNRIFKRERSKAFSAMYAES